MEDLTEIEMGSSVESFQKLVESQKDLFHNQIDQLQRIVVAQCQLTGVNPLSQEMAAGALSINIGKRPRDLINPKAVKYMQEVFSTKDVITKKESREISARFGVTVTQVRDFFNSQRSRVRKLARLSTEKAIRATKHKETNDGIQSTSDSAMPIDSGPSDSNGLEPHPLNSSRQNIVPLNSFSSVAEPLTSIVSNPPPPSSLASNAEPLSSVVAIPPPLSSSASNAEPLSSVVSNLLPLNSIEPSSSEGAPSCSLQNDMLASLNDSEKNFVGSIFNLLQKEETFAGQEKLMEWIMQIQNPLVLDWFLNNGGIMILATWLTQAAAEEQTSILVVTLKVFCHLPLHRALPEHMSAVLQSVNKLRFYRTSDISNRARILVARWSKIFARAQAIKKYNGVKSFTDEQEMILKRSIDEIMSNEQWHANSSNLENGLALSSETSDSTRSLETSQPLKLLPVPTDDQSKKLGLGASASHNKARRKVQLVEQPDERNSSRSPQASKTVPVNPSRPMSADDIQKAKLRALYMQGKHGKAVSSAIGSNGLKKPVNVSSSNLRPVSKAPVQPKVDEQRKHPIPPEKSLKAEGSLDQERIPDSRESMLELCKRVQIPWQTPSEMRLNSLWRVGTGENSKEVEVQKNRNRREMEAKFWTVQEVPPNPKEPWDFEMDYDDSLTVEIPIDQPPDADFEEAQVDQNENENQVAAPPPPVVPNAIAGSVGSAAEPDLELLAVLLKNPDLVFALTSGQAGNVSGADAVKLLDMIKNGGAALATGSNSSVGKPEEKVVEVSLPSPTPSSNPGTSGWKPEAVRNPFSQQSSMANRLAYNSPGVAMASSVQAQNQAGLPLSSQQASSTVFPSFASTRTAVVMPDNRQPSAVPSHVPYHPSVVNSPVMDTITRKASSQVAASSLSSYTARTGPSNYVEPENFVKAAYARNNTPERRPLTQPSSNFSTPSATWSQPSQRITEPELVHSRPPTANAGPISDSWRTSRQGVASNSYGQFNQNNYTPSMRSMQTQFLSGTSRERNLYAGNDGYESWSPDNSPTGSPQYYPPGRNYSAQQTRLNPGREYNPSGYRDYNRNRDGRWR